MQKENKKNRTNRCVGSSVGSRVDGRFLEFLGSSHLGLLTHVLDLKSNTKL